MSYKFINNVPFSIVTDPLLIVILPLTVVIPDMAKYVQSQPALKEIDAGLLYLILSENE